MIEMEGGVWDEEAGTMETAVALAWGRGGERDFGPAWKVLASDPKAVNEADERGRTVLHCCCALPEDRGRQVLINNLLALGADPRVEDIDGWAPRDSDFVSTAESSHEALLARHRAAAQSKDLDYFLRRSAGDPLRVQQALWACSGRHSCNLPLPDCVSQNGGNALHWVCEQLGSAGRALALDQVPREHASPREELWGSKKALLRILRERSRGESRDGGDQITANVAWTTLYDLLCLLLDLGADGESKDGLGRLPSNLLKGGGAMADAAAHLLQDSDWELGDKTREGKALTDAGEYVDAAVGAVLGDEASGTASLEGDFARLSVDHLAADVEEEGLYARAVRAETELREWRRANARLLGERGLQGWVAEDARRNFGRWGLEPGHPARRNTAAQAREVETIAGAATEEEEEGEVEYEMEYEMV